MDIIDLRIEEYVERLTSPHDPLLAELSVLTGLKRKHRDEPLVALLIEAATLHTSANLNVADLADGRAEEIAAAAGVLSHDAVARGQSGTDQTA